MGSGTVGTIRGRRPRRGRAAREEGGRVLRYIQYTYVLSTVCTREGLVGSGAGREGERAKGKEKGGGREEGGREGGREDAQAREQGFATSQHYPKASSPKTSLPQPPPRDRNKKRKRVAGVK